jgi:mannose-6-phosphate isomerase class I
MGNPDNVLRCGFTPKRTDDMNLLGPLVLRGRGRSAASTESKRGEGRYETPAEEFALEVRKVEPDVPWFAPHRRSIEILLCNGGSRANPRLRPPRRLPR